MTDYRWTLLCLLGLRKDMRYRRGLLQGFRSCDKITQDEWKSLTLQVKQRIKGPTLPGYQSNGTGGAWLVPLEDLRK